MLRVLALILLFALAGLVSVLAYHNADVVSLDYVLGRLELPMAIFLGLAFLIGAVVAGLLFLPGYFRQRREIRQLTRALANGRKELDNLRSMPLRDE